MSKELEGRSPLAETWLEVVVFLNAILKRTGRHAIKEITLASQEVGGEFQEDKQSRLDILVKTQEDELIIKKSRILKF